MTYFDHTQVEEKWLQHWSKHGLFQNVANSKKSAVYLLFAFAYPSGSGLHVGHVESKTALDILARFYRMNGKEVFFPVGWDAFGLPAENYAIKTKVHPAITTKKAIDTFRRQIKRLGISYDWETEIATSHPGYYHWTQWIFLQLFKKGLAYQKKAPVNWCSSCQTVLANEQVIEGKCERCDTQVEQKNMKQWFFKITKYQDELISGLDQVDWPQPTKQQQLNWIGKKTGIEITYSIADTDFNIKCFTTRPDTNFGATFVVLAPEHNFVSEILSNQELSKSLESSQKQEIAQYVKTASLKTELDRQADGRKKTGVFSGFYAINPLTKKKMPIWISDFVLAGFGTGAVVGVPGHDKRDFEFATFVNQNYDNNDKSDNNHKIEIKRVVMDNNHDRSAITDLSQVYEDHGIAINSQFLDGLPTPQAIEKIILYMRANGIGEAKTTYRLRDWLISRQRYWGAPIPIVYDPEGNAHPVKEEHLPWLLPTDVNFEPTGESPLVSSKEFIERTELLYGKGWRPEFDTMDTFVDSSWYFLRYVDARNQDKLAEKSKIDAFLPVDMYMIGPEHIVLHLLYSRFFTKFLRDQGYLDFDEPFMKMRHQGMILGPDGKKMSKSKGNVINPDEIIEKFGADTLRMYEMFMGPLEADKPWDTSAVVGIYKFLQRINKFCEKVMSDQVMNDQHLSLSSNLSSNSYSEVFARKLHQTIEKLTYDIASLKFNTAIASMMECLNTAEKEMGAGKKIQKNLVFAYIKLLSIFCPFLAEDLYQRYFAKLTSVHLESWPVYDPSIAQESQITVVVQVDGKFRDQVLIPSEKIHDQDYVVNQAKSAQKVSKYLAESAIKKVIYVPGKILNFVV